MPLWTLIITLVLCSGVYGSESANEQTPDYTPGVIIVKFRSDDKAEIGGFLSRSGAYLSERAFPQASESPQRLSAIYKLQFSTGADVESISRRYERDPVVEYAQPNYVNHLCEQAPAALNDLYYEDQWALSVIDALKAWKIEKGSSDVVIAIVDTGVDYEHEDLKSRIWINPGEIEGNGQDDDGNGYIDDIRGWDFADSPELPSDVDCVDRDNDPMDENGHGTHVSGIAAAVPDNGKGIAGITWNCRIMALRGGGKFLEDDDLSAAIVYAADNGAHVINMSWGGDSLSYMIRDTIEYAFKRGCVLVAAAGNDNRPAVIYPALHKQVIAVGATDRWDKKASFSNYGPEIDIAAPGHKVFGTTPGSKYSDWSGTSMASPVVSGVAALMLSKRPGLTNAEVAQILRSTADKLDDPLFAGIGRVNAAKALSASSSLIASITSPDNGSGADKTLTIRGTAAGFSFLRFQLEYGAIPDAANDIKWAPITHLQDSVFDDLLGTWDTAHLDEGDYVVRLRVYGDGGVETEDRLIINVDHSSPEITEVRSTAILDADSYRYEVVWKTDDLTFGEFCYRQVGSGTEFKRLLVSYVDDEHSIYVSDELAPGSYEYFIKAVNRAALVSYDDNSGKYYPLDVGMLRVTPDGFSQIALDVPAIYPVSATADFDGDGQIEIVGMDSSNYIYDTVRIYERDAAGNYEEVFATENADFFPWDIGDTDGDGLLEILGNYKDLTYLYESPSPGLYPTEKIWEKEGMWGGRIADMDLDGNREIILRYLDTNEIYVYENRGDRDYIKAARLPNPTGGDNYLATTFAISDFDGDGHTELAAGDWDGEIFIYENTRNDGYSHTWTGSVPNALIKYVTSGDFNGDGQDEFVVEARADEPPDVAKRRWIYTIFACSGQDRYEAVWSQEIKGIRGSLSGVSSGDLDGDGQDEIVILVTPNLYIFKVADASGTGNWQVNPVWHHSASKTQWPIVDDLDADGANEVIFNVADRLAAFKWSQADRIQISRPWGLTATPLGESEVELKWNGPPEARSYKIYRGTNKENLYLIDTLVVQASLPVMSTVQFFHDNGLRNGTEYWYSVASVNAVGEQSKLSESISATPNSPPGLMSAEYVPPSGVRLTFSEPMGSSAQTESHYMIASETRFSALPFSAVLDYQGKRVILTIERGIPQGIYTVTVSDVRDATGVAISSDDNSATFYVPAPDSGIFTDLNRMIVYPNPVMPNSRHPGWVTFRNLPPETTIHIYNPVGELVQELNDMHSGEGKILWYLDNDDHRDAASGVYIYLVECKGDSRTGKLAVVR